jgi:hypothetical protein
MEDVRCVVYGLSLDGENYRYIGMTTGTLRQRWAGHVSAAKRSTRRTAVRCWITAHGADAIKVTVLERCSSTEELLAAEVRWISQFRAAGVPLLNHTDGGEGTVGWTPTVEQREAMRARFSGAGNPNYGKQRPESVKQAIREKLAGRPGGALGIPKTEEHKAKLRGRVISEETRRKMSESAKRRGPNNKGRPMSDDQKEALRVAALGRKHTPESRAKISEAQRGRPKSPEHRAAIAEAVRRARAGRKLQPGRVPALDRPSNAEDPGVSPAADEVLATSLRVVVPTPSPQG